MLLATGGGPTMYRTTRRRATRAATAWRWRCAPGLPLRDMEMVQFHPTGLLAGPHTRMTGTVLEEGLRGAGGYLLERRAASASCSATIRAASARRATSSRARSSPRCAPGARTPNGGVYIAMAHLGAEQRARASSRAWSSAAPIAASISPAAWSRSCPTAHYMMGGVEFARRLHAPRCAGLFVAGEDSGGVHGANRLGGNGVANSTVFGGIAGDAMAAWAARERRVARARRARRSKPRSRAASARSRKPRGRPRGDARSALRRDVGRRRHPARRGGLARARGARSPSSTRELDAHRRRRRATARFNLTWHDWLNLKSLIAVSRGDLRRGAGARGFARRAFPRGFSGDRALETSQFSRVRDMARRATRCDFEPVAFTRVRPGQTLLAA